jgi:hypothetical protein
MKRSTPVFLFFILCMTMLLSGSCTLFTFAKQTTYKIVDQGSGRLRQVYTLAENARRPSQVECYNSRQQLVKSYALEYGADGRLARAVSTAKTATAPLKSEVTYTYADTYTASGKLAGTTQTSSEGKSVTTYFGYDDAGALRGAVEKTGSAILAKDYAQ